MHLELGRTIIHLDLYYYILIVTPRVEKSNVNKTYSNATQNVNSKRAKAVHCLRKMSLICIAISLQGIKTCKQSDLTKKFSCQQIKTSK